MATILMRSLRRCGLELKRLLPDMAGASKWWTNAKKQKQIQRICLLGILA